MNHSDDDAYQDGIKLPTKKDNEMLDIRLDFISDFREKDVAVAEMSDVRQKFINTDSYLAELGEQSHDGAFKRAISLARTHNEQALQYTIKSLCLFWENKQ